MSIGAVETTPLYRRSKSTHRNLASNLNGPSKFHHNYFVNTTKLQNGLTCSNQDKLSTEHVNLS